MITLLGKIIEVNGNEVIIKLNIDLESVDNLVDHYVIFEDGKEKLIGEITRISNNNAYINLLGQFINNKFVFGIITKPSFKAKAKIISNEKIDYIIGIERYSEDKHLYFGTSPVYEDISIGVKIDDFFSNHFAIFGNTGSGKSCSVARILQNLLEKQEYIPYRSNIFLFDTYGEYSNAFKNINNNAIDINFKQYTTNLKAKEDIVKIPPWLLTVDDYALLLNVGDASQIPVIEKALKLVGIFIKKDDTSIKCKNSIIAKNILEILTSGNTPAQIRDQVFSVLTYYNTRELNLDSKIVMPGYTRPVKQCFVIDSSGKIREMELLMSFFNSFISDDFSYQLPDGTFKYTMDGFKEALNYALISEGSLKSNNVYDKYNDLKVRFEALLKSQYKKFFSCDDYVTLEQFICDLLITKDKKKAQLVSFNLNYVDDRFAKTLTKIYCHILFDYAKNLKNRASFPMHIILEEAHHYVKNDNDISIIGYNIFERITKEGRKYAIIMGLISQRPLELSETCLSQCSNFLVFKMLHPKDLEYIKGILPNIQEYQYNRLSVLPPGTCIAFGNAFKMPTFIKFDMPNPTPSSSNAKISDIWFTTKP